jgi:hypothetical protein
MELSKEMQVGEEDYMGCDVGGLVALRDIHSNCVTFF